MKKVILIIVLCIIGSTIRAQDTLVMKDGSVVLAKILDLANGNVSYKRWGFDNGPTFIKAMDAVATVKRGQQNVIIHELKNEIKKVFSSCDANQIKKRKKTKCVSGNEIATYIDSIYVEQPSLIEFAIPKYIESLPQCVNMSCIRQCYLDLFNSSCDAKDADNITKYGEIYLCLNPDKDVPSVIGVLARLFASEGKETKTQLMINKFEAFDSANDNFFTEDIENLKKETYELLHPKRLQDEYLGRWVRTDELLSMSSPQYPYSPMMLRIDNVSDENESKAYFLDKSHRTYYRKKDGIYTMDIDRINSSQGISFNGVARFVAIQFSNKDIKDRAWLEGVASVGSETMRQIGADANATIWSSKSLSTGEKFATGLATSLLISGISDLIASANYSYERFLDYKFILMPPTPNGLMEANVSRFDQTIDNNGLITNGENYQDKRMEFVRWEECDSLFFVSFNGEPITLFPYRVDDPTLKEYYEIKKTYSLRNKGYWIPFLSCNAFATYLFVRSFFIREESYYKNGQNYVLNFDGRRVHDDDNWSKSWWFFGTSLTTYVISNAVIFGNMANGRRKAFFGLNQKNLSKLRYKGSVSVSLSPLYDPINNALGATANITF